MLDIRSRSRRVALRISRPTLVRMNNAMGTRTMNISVSCQLIQDHVGLGHHVLDGLLTVLGGVADIIARGADDVREAPLWVVNLRVTGCRCANQFPCWRCLASYHCSTPGCVIS